MIKLYSLKCKGLIKHFAVNAFSNFEKRKEFYQNINQSMYYKPRVKVSEFLTNHGISFRENDRSIRIKQCTFCTKPHHHDMGNLFCLTVDKITGVYHCFRCDARGSWMDLKKNFLGIEESDISTIFKDQLHETGSEHPTNEISQVEYMIYQHNLQTPQYADVRDYLKSRGFKQNTIKKYKIGAGVSKFLNQHGEAVDIKVIYFPMYRLAKKNKRSSQQDEATHQNYQNVVITKTKLKGASKQTKKYLRQYPTGAGSGLFGLNTIKQTDRVVVLTEGQFDAMAVHQQTGYPAISLPFGANSLPDSLVCILNQFTKIILWMDNDEAGKLGSQKIAYKLGIQRTHVVKCSDKNLKDANDYLLKAPQKMSKILESSKSQPDENIMTFADLRQSVKNRIFKYQQYRGITIDWLPFFNKKVKGVRMEQLSIFSGPTGSGKTTFLSQLTLDLCKKDIPILWGSFQIRNQVLLTNMLLQHSQTNLVKSTQNFDFFSDSFQKLPLYLLNFHGSTRAEKALDIIEYAIQKHNISVVVIDTLQFFLSGQAQGSLKFDLQDKVMSAFRNIATKYKVHIIVVIHPRKVQESEDIQINSIYGSSKATQQADNVWIIQNRENFKIFDIKKNRFDGELGKTALGFDKGCKRFLQLNKEQLTSLYNKSTTMNEILEKRQGKSNSADDSEMFVLGTEEDEGAEAGQMMKRQKYPKKKNPMS